MSTSIPKAVRFTESEWQELEKSSDTRYEYVDGFVYAMAGESDQHNDVISNLVESLRPKARAKGCQFRHSSYRVYIEKLNRFYYPDVVISCAEESDRYAFRSPCFILEVPSPSTADKDCREKLDAYSKIPSLQTYVLVSQDEPRVEIYERRRWNWTYVEMVNGGELEIPCLGENLSLEQIYAGLGIPGAEIKPL